MAIETLTLVVGPCRSGTTFLLNWLNARGYLCLFQPLKHQIRWSHYNGSRKNVFNCIPQDYCGNLSIKEALGPYHIEEVSYDPVAKILDCLPVFQNINLVFLIRNPKACLSSWSKAFYGGKITPQFILVFNEAYKNIHTLINKYSHIGNLWVLNIDSELQMKTGLCQIEKFSANRNSMINTGFEKIIKFRDPDGYEVSGLLDKAKKSNRYNKSLVNSNYAGVDHLDLSYAMDLYNRILKRAI